MQVSFPGIGIEMTVNRVAFNLFGMPIYWYGVIIAIGLIMGIITASLAAEKDDLILDIVLVCTPVSVVFARLYYVIFKWDMYKNNLMDIFDIRSGGIAIYGAVIGAVLAAYVYAKAKKKNPLFVFDVGSVGLITGQMIGRWGNLIWSSFAAISVPPEVAFRRKISDRPKPIRKPANSADNNLSD